MSLNKQLAEGITVHWHNEYKDQDMTGTIVKFYTNSALIDITNMKNYQDLGLGDFTIAATKRLKLKR